MAFWWEAAPFAACCLLLLLLLLLLPLAMHGEARMHAVAPVDTWCPQCLCTMSYVVTTTATADQTASEQLGLCTAVLFWPVGMECPERTCYPLGHYKACGRPIRCRYASLKRRRAGGKHHL